MLTTEWNLEDAQKVWYEEGREEGWEEGLEKGLEKGREEIARSALMKGFPVDIIRDITGLDIQTITSLSQ
jgi:predicted transposase/invertase (TIGR01784 family)